MGVGGWVRVVGVGRGVVVVVGRVGEGGKSHFLMLSRRAAVLHCVA